MYEYFYYFYKKIKYSCIITMVYKITLYSYTKAEENDLSIVPSTKRIK